MNKEPLTASRMSSLLSCPRKHFLSYEIGLKSNNDAMALRFGSAWHRAMEARWNKADFETALAAAIADTTFDEITLATLSGLLAGYYAHYANEEVATLHPEVEFRHDIKGSRTFDSAGKIDGLGTMHDGRICKVEHKTAGEDISNESDYWLRLNLNQQVLQYVTAARLHGWNVEVVLYDVTRKPAIRQKQNETPEQFGERLAADTKERPDFYFQRRECPVLDCDLAEFEVQRLELARNILAYRKAERRLEHREQAWPRNVNGITCRQCSFSSFCLQNLRVNPDMPPSGFHVGEKHSELSAAIGEVQ